MASSWLLNAFRWSLTIGSIASLIVGASIKSTLWLSLGGALLGLLVIIVATKADEFIGNFCNQCGNCLGSSNLFKCNCCHLSPSNPCINCISTCMLVCGCSPSNDEESQSPQPQPMAYILPNNPIVLAELPAATVNTKNSRAGAIKLPDFPFTWNSHCNYIIKNHLLPKESKNDDKYITIPINQYKSIFLIRLIHTFVL